MDLGAASAQHAAVYSSKLVLPALICLALSACLPVNPNAIAGDGSTTVTNQTTQTLTASTSGGILRIGQAAADLGTLDPDFVYSLQKAANKTTSAYASDYAGMTFANPDPYTVTVTLDEAMSTALFYPRFANYSGGYILCKRAADQLALDGLKTHPVGTGPFMFKDYSPGEKVDLLANPAYLRGRPQLDGIEYRRSLEHLLQHRQATLR